MLTRVRRWTIAGALLTGALFAACQGSTLEPLPLDVRVDLTPATANRGDTVLAVATAQGGTLLGITIDFGDGVSDSYNTAGARTAKVTFKHAYTSSGAYTVKVVVTDGVAGDKAASTLFRVN
jgi:PKD domain